MRVKRSGHDAVCVPLEGIIMSGSRVFAAALHQPLAILPVLVDRIMQLETILEILYPEIFEAVQVALLHHDLQDQGQLIHPLPQCQHPLTEQFSEPYVVIRAMSAHQIQVLFRELERR